MRGRIHTMDALIWVFSGGLKIQRLNIVCFLFLNSPKTGLAHRYSHNHIAIMENLAYPPSERTSSMILTSSL